MLLVKSEPKLCHKITIQALLGDMDSTTCRVDDMVMTDLYNAHIVLGRTIITVDSELNVLKKREIPDSLDAISPDLDLGVALVCTYADHGCQSSEIRWIDLDTLQPIRIEPENFEQSDYVTFLPDGESFLLGVCGTLIRKDVNTGGSIILAELANHCPTEYVISVDWRYIAIQAGGGGNVPVSLFRIGGE